MRNPLFVVKLGGSIISSKREGTPTILKEQILRIAREIKSVRDKNFFDLILIHGAGSFGHEMAKKYKLWEGITKKSQYLPFSKTQSQTIFLNHTILEIFGSVGLPVIGINPSTIITQNNKNKQYFDTKIIEHFLVNHFIPVLYGTVVPDKILIGSICSGDTMLCFLAKKFRAKRAIFASDVDGVFTQDPHRFPNAQLIAEITSKNYKEVIQGTQGSASTIDVGGGMRGKLTEIHDLAQGIEVWIVNGSRKGIIGKILNGKEVKGTKIFL